jgi:hypothetical protein
MCVLHLDALVSMSHVDADSLLRRGLGSGIEGLITTAVRLDAQKIIAEVVDCPLNLPRVGTHQVSVDQTTITYGSSATISPLG